MLCITLFSHRYGRSRQGGGELLFHVALLGVVSFARNNCIEDYQPAVEKVRPRGTFLHFGADRPEIPEKNLTENIEIFDALAERIAS